MYASVIGNDHNNNQDFVISGKNYGIVADGCSSSCFSEVGTRLTKVMDKIISLLQEYNNYIKDDYYTTDLLTRNFLFTLIACFEKKDKFVVYLLGDGYIITQNKLDEISYIHSSYKDNKPPYIAYNYCTNKKSSFKKFEFSKDLFKGVGVATDGIEPFVSKYVGIGLDGKKKFEDILLNVERLDEEALNTKMNNLIKLYHGTLYDDTTIYFAQGR